MDIIKHARIWVDQEVKQGRVMFLIGLLLIPFFVWISKNDMDFIEGFFIPFFLILLILLGYGFNLIFSRPRHLNKLIREGQKDRSSMEQKEYKRIEKDMKTYGWMMKVWPVIFATSLLGFFFVNSDFNKGVCMGIGVLSIVGFSIDRLLSKRLDKYFNQIKN